MGIKSVRQSIIIFTTTVFYLSLSSCATLNKSECQSANWQIIGLEDGSHGRNKSYIGEHRKACAEYNISPDLKEYLKGYTEGIRQFCTEDNGYQQGLNGKSKINHCPTEISALFNKGYQKGIAQYKLRMEIMSVRKAIKNNHQRLAEISKLKPNKESELIDRHSTENRRRELLEEIKELERESEAILFDIDQLQKSLVGLENQYYRIYGINF